MKKSTKNEVNNIVDFSDDGVKLNVDFDLNKETFWLSQKQMSELKQINQQFQDILTMYIKKRN